MRISLALPTDRVDHPGEFLTAEAVCEVATRAELLGFDAVHVTDHPAPGRRWLEAGGHHSLDPAAVLTLAAAATHRLLLHTNVYVLPYRNPWLAAKALATVDVLSGGRLIVGVAAGYLRAEFAALGAHFDRRGAALDEAIAGLIAAWSGPVEVDGEEVLALPHPVQSPHPPLWAGGNSDAAIRRAATTCQGWSPMPAAGRLAATVRTPPIDSIDTLAARIAALHQRAAAAGRPERPDVCFVPFSLAAHLAAPGAATRAALAEELDRLEEVGVTWCALTLPGTTRAELLGHMEELATAVR